MRARATASVRARRRNTRPKRRASKACAAIRYPTVSGAKIVALVERVGVERGVPLLELPTAGFRGVGLGVVAVVGHRVRLACARDTVRRDSAGFWVHSTASGRRSTNTRLIMRREGKRDAHGRVNTGMVYIYVQCRWV